ncbi:hypothetical protein ACOYYK_15165, partial [Enterococcus gallinarum]|uniref:hypothetical protein n=1 Tax=Enterococcus gallinarum TaxID=1353 RepID=UPI003BE65765
SFLLLSFSIILPYLIVDLKLCNRTLQFDLEAIKQAGYDPTVICVVTNKENFIIKPIEQTENMSKSEGVLSISPFVS